MNWILKLCLVSTLLVSAFQWGYCDPIAIGTAYYIPNYNLLGEDMPGGYSVFKSLSSKCVLSTNYSTDDDTETYYADTESFFERVGEEYSISSDVRMNFTLGTTLQRASRNISNSTNTVTGYTFETYAKVADDLFQQSCTADEALDDQLLQDFEQLPVKVEKPWFDSSWDVYQQFLVKYGTHVVTHIGYGSSLFINVFADTKHDYSQRNLVIRACAELGGPSLKLSVCMDITELEAEASLENIMTSTIVIRGGTDEMREKLYQNRSNELIEQFLAEAATARAPIHYKFIGIWDIIKARFPRDSAPANNARALNLEQFFKGYLNYGCKYQTDASVSDKTLIELQKFSYSNTTPSYLECSLAPEGCHTNDDCHYRNVGWCECRGCVRYYEEKLNTGRMKEYAVVYNGSSYKFPGCRISGWGTSCACKTPIRIREVVWKLDDNVT